MKKKKVLITLMAVLLAGTAIFTIFVFFPNLVGVKTVNTDDITILEQDSEEEIQYEDISDGLNISSPYSGIVNFELVNRTLPEKWEEKQTFFRYTYLGEYSNETYQELNDLLVTDYNWKNQLNEDGDILLGGPMILVNGVYQLHVHNGLSLASKYYLFGDLLEYLEKKDLLEETRIRLGGVKLECIWVKKIHVKEINTVPGGVEMVISTCLERNGDYRLVSGWKSIEE